MDGHSDCLKSFDSRDILLFPVKRANDIYTNLIYTEKHQNITGFNVLRNCRKKIKKQKKKSNELNEVSDLKFLNSTKLAVNKRYQNISKIIQSTVSNQDNSIKRHNERSILKRQIKIHNIKKSESNNSCNYNYYKANYENLFGKGKHTNDSLNMDRNRRKENKKRTARLKRNDSNECSGCECSHCKNDYQFNNFDGRKSRVTIFGQLGLTQDDQYILNCAATLNDKPIQTSYTDKNTSLYQQESNNGNETKATQATQVNFNFPMLSALKNYKNKTVQCSCNNTNCTNMVTYVSDSETEDNELKQCKSPLVVISVYPRTDSEENIKNNPVKIIRHQTSPQNKMLRNSNQINNTQVKTERKPKPEIKNISYVERKFNKSRSPSPTLETASKPKNKTVDSNIGTNNKPKRLSPLRHTSPDKSTNKSNDFKQNIVCNTSKFIKETDFRKEQQQRDVRNSKEQVKKALVNSFLINNKLLDPKENTSKITIDINGDKEKYNVLFEQRQFDTGLTVRKTVKAQSHKKSGHNDGKLINKLLLLSDNEDEEFCKSRSPRCRNIPKLLVSKSRLKVKDSLEMCHRREDINSSRIEFNESQTNLVNNPSKHYRGDNCSVTDPDERDKEIRKLLGVLRDNRHEDREEPKIICHKNENEDRCIHNKRVKELTIEPNFPTFPSNQVLTIKIKKEIQTVERDSSHFNNQKVKNNVLYVQTKTEYKNGFIRNNNKSSNQFNNLVANNASLQKHNFVSSVENDNETLNRYAAVFTHKDRIKNQRPILLTKKQYDKVKRIIKSTVSKKFSSEKRKRYNVKHCNVVSIGNIKIKRRLEQKSQCDCEAQTDTIFKCVGSQYEPQCLNILHCKKSDRKASDIFNVPRKHRNDKSLSPRHALSSMEIRYASIGYIQHVSISSIQFGKDKVQSFHNNNVPKDDTSLRTIFKGPPKSVTPNLGTSAYSLNSNSRNGSNYSIKPPLYSGDCKMKKPFLQRLLSCLVMRSPQSSDLKDVEKRRKLPEHNSSLDSYFISSSLGALKMSSSFYDTTASFYSNHSIIPINKTKKGFFNSVRGFLTIKRN